MLFLATYWPPLEKSFASEAIRHLSLSNFIESRGYVATIFSQKMVFSTHLSASLSMLSKTSF